jgi:hypothetical protein
MNRYSQLNTLIESVKPTTIVEVGTWNGLRALDMCQTALKHNPNVHYIGFDLFETGTPEIDSAELNAKKRVSMEQVVKTLEGHGFSFELHEGNSKETLPKVKIPDDAFVFIDGGHSVETIKSDYDLLKHCKTVVLDDWYQKDESGNCVDTKLYGCNTVIHGEEFLIMPATDPVREGGLVRMAVKPPQAWPGKMKIQVQTRNCVPEKNIQANVKYNVQFFEKYLEECEPHDATAVIVSGGPSRLDFLEEVKEIAGKEGHYIFCVKTSHDWLIKEGIIPWACLLLDPRPHVLDFIETPHKDIRYITASMVHPVTMDRLVEAKAQIWGYHAFVGAGEAKAVQKELGDAMMISGGSTAASRGMSVLHSIGFRKFILIGFDSSYKEKPTKEETHGLKKKDPIMVDCEGRQFWTDLELLAQAQDFEKLIKLGKDIHVEVRGDGLIPHLFRVKHKKRKEFTELFNG